jgi:hypothetical protein
VKRPVCIFASPEIVPSFEADLQEMADGWWLKPFYSCPGLVIDFEGGLVRKIIQDAAVNPGNAARLYLSDIMSGRITPYNPIASMARLGKDALMAGYLTDLLNELSEGPVPGSVESMVRRSLVALLEKARDSGISYSLVQLGRTLDLVFKKQNRGDLAESTRSLFRRLDQIPYQLILGEVKPTLPTETILENNLIYVLDASLKRISDFLEPAKEAALCQYDSSVVALIAGLLLIDFVETLKNMYNHKYPRQSSLVVMVNGYNRLPSLPWVAIISNLTEYNAKGFLTPTAGSASISVSELGANVRLFYDEFPNSFDGGRGFSPFEPMKQYTYAISVLLEGLAGNSGRNLTL